MEPCDICAAGKTKQKNVPNKSEQKPATNMGARIYIVLATVKNPRNLDMTVTKPHQKISVNERTGNKTSRFNDNNNDQVEPMCVYMHERKDANITVKYFRFVNAGGMNHQKSEHITLINFGYTAHDTPQQNHLSELGFATISNRGISPMHA